MNYQELINQGFIYLYRFVRYLTNLTCSPVLSNTGKCIRGKNSNMLVSFQSGSCIVLARQLRRLDKLALKETTFYISKVERVISNQLALPF